MKKMLVFLAALACLLCLSACGKAPAGPSVTEPSVTGPSVADPVGNPMTETAQRLGLTAENYPRIDGSTSTLGIVHTLWDHMVVYGSDFYFDRYPEAASKTVPSYHRLIENEVDLILAPYPSAAVLAAAEDAGVELEFHKIAAEALIFITPAENTAENITRDQARSIYLDYGITDWRELGGPDRELVPICRNADSGSQAQMDNLVLEGAAMHPDIQNNYVELTMEGMLEQVAFYHNGGMDGEPTGSYALGYTLYSYLWMADSITGIAEHLRVLSYEGVVPTAESITDGSYPLSDGYYAVVRSGLPEDHSARAVIQWLQSAEGAAAMEGVGILPCPARAD